MKHVEHHDHPLELGRSHLETVPLQVSCLQLARTNLDRFWGILLNNISIPPRDEDPNGFPIFQGGYFLLLYPIIPIPLFIG